jgi:hypothetical protein
MDRTSKEQDIKERGEAYQRGLIALSESLRQFKELTGIDLTADIDVSGRHMGQAPYVKLTAERLAEVTALIEGDIWQASEALAEVTDVLAADATVISIDRKVESCRVEAPPRRLVIEPYRPGLVRR